MRPGATVIGLLDDAIRRQPLVAESAWAVTGGVAYFDAR